MGATGPTTNPRWLEASGSMTSLRNLWKLEAELSLFFFLLNWEAYACGKSTVFYSSSDRRGRREEMKNIMIRDEEEDQKTVNLKLRTFLDCCESSKKEKKTKLNHNQDCF